MGKATGFLEYQREIASYKHPEERINDWEEFRSDLPTEKLKIQAARCMNCGVPYCHMGITINGVTSGCPIYNLIPEFNDLIYRGLWTEAFYRLNKTNNFPEFTGRVCPAPCEGSCTVGINDPAVTIKQIELSIIENAFSEGLVLPSNGNVPTGKSVAVVGSGPAGLACADQLLKVGHEVIVFERADRIGGLVMYGIPNMKLDKKIVNRRIECMKAAGAIFVTNTEVGVDYPCDRLLKDSDAVVLCCGATKPRDLPVAGRHHKGIYFAMEFLHNTTKSILDKRQYDSSLDVKGKDVVVIGGGDTGNDCVGTSIRQGCKSVVQFEILNKPPLKRAEGNPWPEWPNIFRVDYGQEEAHSLYGKDPREYCTMTKKFVEDDNGSLKEIHTVQVKWERDTHNRPIPVEIKGTHKVWKAQIAFLAMGFLGPEDKLLGQLGINRDGRSNVKAEYGTFATNIKGIFTAGDMRRGQSLVVWAINEGRGAARECDRYLMGYTELP